MRRMSTNDIVITPEDRPGAHFDRAKADTTPTAKAKAKPKARAKRKPAAPSLEFTPLQKGAAWGVTATALVVGLAVLWHSGAPHRLAGLIGNKVLEATANAGLRVEEITIVGRSRTPSESIVQALDLDHGDPILGFDIGRAKDRLEAIASVRAVAVERRLPGSIHLVVAEREPVAIWQSGGRYILIDRMGHEIPGPIDGFTNLPVVVGDGAPQRADDLLTLLAGEPMIASRVKAAIRVGGRRWDLKLDDVAKGVEVKLPEDEPQAALARLAGIEREHALLGRRLSMIDLRHPERLVLRAEREPAADRRKDNGV